MRNYTKVSNVYLLGASNLSEYLLRHLNLLIYL